MFSSIDIILYKLPYYTIKREEVLEFGQLFVKVKIRYSYTIRCITFELPWIMCTYM